MIVWMALVGRAAEIGQAAPGFSLTALDGTRHSLAQYRGKIVVIEWTNPGCPYVQDAHASGGALDGLATKESASGVVWLAINSGAPGKQGHGLEVNRAAAAEWKLSHPVLVDEDGAVGRAYGAVTTPHMYVVDPQGVLVYQGAIDDHPLRRGDGTPVNYVAKALADLRSGRPVATPSTKPYGCSVKY